MPLDKAFSDICGGKNPSAYYFVPLHFKDRRFGFAAVNSVTVSIPLTNSFGRGPITSAWL